MRDTVILIAATVIVGSLLAVGVTLEILDGGTTTTEIIIRDESCNDTIEWKD